MGATKFVVRGQKKIFFEKLIITLRTVPGDRKENKKKPQTIHRFLVEFDIRKLQLIRKLRPSGL